MKWFTHVCGESNHKFEARFTEEPSGYELEVIRGISAKDLRNLVTLNKYEKDVCIYCGKEVVK